MAENPHEITPQGMMVNHENELIPSKATFSVKAFEDISITLLQAFPAINTGWLALLREILKDEGYSDQDLKKAVLKVIKEETFTGAPPAIAKFCNQVKRVKLYTSHDVDALVHQGKESYKNFGMVHRGKNGVLFAKRADIEKYDIEELAPTPVYLHQVAQDR